jgi:hypothetical protein
METASPETALQCLVAIARHHGIDVSTITSPALVVGARPWHSGQN